MIHPELWTMLSGQDPADVQQRACARVDADGAYVLDVAGREYRIDPQRKIVEPLAPAPNDRPDFHLWLSSVVYLIRAQVGEPSGEWISPRQFPYGEMFFRGPHEIPVNKLTALFGNDRDAFARAAQKVGGKEERFGDVAYAVRVFPRVPVLVVLWLQDEEFPARGTMLVDKTAHDHLPLDALWSALHVVQNAIVAAHR